MRICRLKLVLCHHIDVIINSMDRENQCMLSNAYETNDYLASMRTLPSEQHRCVHAATRAISCCFETFVNIPADRQIQKRSYTCQRSRPAHALVVPCELRDHLTATYITLTSPSSSHPVTLRDGYGTILIHTGARNA
jgi:hypothetical protein